MAEFSMRGLKKVYGTKDQRLVIHDPRTPGLRAELREGGAVTFFVYKRLPGGGPVRVKVGDFPAVTVDKARREAHDVLSELSQGRDVARDRRQRREEPTLKTLFDHFLETHAKLHKRTWQEDQRQFDKLLRIWRSKRLSTIHTQDVRSLHARLGKKHGRYAANRVLALLRSLFNRAGEIGFTGPNPTASVRKFKEESRERVLSVAEMPAFFAAVEAEPNKTLRDFFFACLWTGARRGNVAAMRWADVDFSTSTWRIPETKSGDPVRVHLSDEALAILRERQEEREDGAEFVFPSRRSGAKTPYLSSPKDAWKKLLDRAGLSDLRMHDLRRTFGSFQAADGASLPVIGKSLGHRSTASTAVYARLNLDPVRVSVDRSTAAIRAAAEGGDDE